MPGDTQARIYRGYPYRTAQGGYVVKVEDHRGLHVLDPGPSQDLRNHSPDGFAWGYGGSGPAQLALALLLDATGNPELALRDYQAFKNQVIAGLHPDRPWSYSREQVLQWVGARGLLEA